MEAGDACLLSTGRPACLITVVGSSGAGKDSVMAASQQRLADCADVHFVQRVITRDSDAGFESHTSVSVDQFLKQQHAGAFSLTWQAHGLHYGVPVDITNKVNSGITVVLNGSRQALQQTRHVYPSMRVVHLLVDPLILAARLASRGRENKNQIGQRLARQLPVDMRDNLDVEIHNNGELHEAVDAFVAFVNRVRTTDAGA